ncbi:MAG: thiopurine S-methyltransferase [Pseudomonadota bacterium]
MDKQFWLDRWRNDRIGFHEGKPNSLLVKHFGKLTLRQKQTIFLPLCGKAVDIDWLLQQGVHVVGIDLSPLAIKAVFERLGALPEVIVISETVTKFKHGPLTLFTGDFFALTKDTLGPVDAVYDRAALVALPPDMRVRYAGHLRTITGGATQLLITFAYDQAEMEGPPFSVPTCEVDEHYGSNFNISVQETKPLTLKTTAAIAEISLLARKT